MAVKKRVGKKPAPKKKSTPTKATTYSTGKTRAQINKEKADMIRRGYGAPQPTKRDARKGRKATSKIGGRKSITIKKTGAKKRKSPASGYSVCTGSKCM